ncbi:Vacuolar protein sorting-associated protein 72-like protein [Frankliniella fusca]|uniref:Vacuolar protein sorting-associated protein 72 homolog n=1 Tax=Frankliniella fusca TaxID=407009 RepID=A0AAE1HXU8_9NEOP|nr:Vacuolar protein sorting-associated protein 72-like protein [Frankliniella fusca]
MLATSRSRRSNAGAQMAKLLEDLQEDDFYKSTYGGFEESEDDNDFQSGDEKEVADDVDSDFSIEENDEPISDHEDDAPKRQKKVVTKAYKEPKPTPPPGAPEKKPKVPKQRKPKMTADMYERKSIRKSTVKKSEETQLRVKKRKEEGPRKHRRHRDYFYEPTQEEKLAEARVTEEENLKSLEKYQKMELEKKKTRGSKKGIIGPTIRYHSVAMPLIEELPSNHGLVTEEKINVEDTNEDVIMVGDAVDSQPIKETEEKVKDEEQPESTQSKVYPRCERTFLTFSDESIFRRAYRLRKARVPQRSYCLITRQRAKYKDPATQAPFCNASTFRALRDVLALHLEHRPGNDPETVQWLEYKRKEREERQAAAQQIACKVRLTPSMQAAHVLQAVAQGANQAAASSA